MLILAEQKKQEVYTDYVESTIFKGFFGNDFEKWILQCDLIFRINGTEDQRRKALWLSTAFSGVVFSWYEMLPNIT